MNRRRGHGEGSVTLRSDGRWHGRVDLGWQEGRRVRKSVYGNTQAEVIRKMRAVQAAVAKGVPVGDERVTVGEWLNRWIASLPDDLSPNTVDNYRWAIDKHLAPAFGQTKVVRLTPSDVAAFLQAKSDAGLSKSSRMRVRSVLLLALRQAEIEGIVARNVAALTRAPSVVEKQGRSLTASEARALLNAATGTPLEVALRLGLLLGLRPGEVLGLSWSDVDVEGGVIHVRGSLKRERDGLRLGPPKTPKSRRSLAIPAPLADALRAHGARQAAQRLAAGPTWRDSGLVVTSAVGGPVDPSNYRRAFSTVCQAAGLGHWHPNELRHSFVSLLHADGVPLDLIADLVGHDGTRMTSGVYRHLVDPVVPHAVAPVERLFGDAASGP